VRVRYVMLSAYLVRIEIGIENNHRVGAPEVNAHLIAVGVSIEDDHRKVGVPPLPLL
jgi:hypothetical protein